jgi:hypothetical protein
VALLFLPERKTFREVRLTASSKARRIRGMSKLEKILSPRRKVERRWSSARSTFTSRAIAATHCDKAQVLEKYNGRESFRFTYPAALASREGPSR